MKEENSMSKVKLTEDNTVSPLYDIEPLCLISYFRVKDQVKS